jgi:predicted RNase H-like HicB family nuclease
LAWPSKLVSGYIDQWKVAMKFKIALYPSEEGFSVNVPGLPGCWSQGATEAEALANIAEAIREYVEAEMDPTDGAEIREIEVV